MLAMSMGRSTTLRKRPRVAGIGLDESQLAAIRPYCGDLRPAQNVSHYLHHFSWTETDVVVAGGLNQDEIDPGVHLLTIGPMSHGVWQQFGVRPTPRYRELARMDTGNRERELAVAPQSLPVYRSLADSLAHELSRAEQPPPTATAPETGELLRHPVVVTSGIRWLCGCSGPTGHGAIPRRSRVSMSWRSTFPPCRTSRTGSGPS